MENPRLKLYVTNDDPDDLELLSVALVGHLTGLHLIKFNDGHLLFDHLSTDLTDLPGVIVLDLNMPVMNGYQTLENLKLNKALSQIPIVIMTTSAKAEDKPRYQLLGRTHFVEKPHSFTGFSGIAALFLFHAGQPSLMNTLH